MLKFALAGLIVAGSLTAAVAMPAAQLSVQSPLPVTKTAVVVRKTIVRRRAPVVVRRRAPVVVRKTIVR